MNITKRSFGAYTELTLTADTKEEVINWRNYFFNWGSLTLAAGNNIDLSEPLDRQEREIEETREGYRLAFQAKKDKIIAAFRNSAEANFDWDSVTEKGGKKARIAAHKDLEIKALERFDAIPCLY